MTGWTNRHEERDEGLSHHREELLKQALEDLTNDKDVLAIYLNGSLAKGNADRYSDIDLHIIVAPGRKGEFIKAKASRTERWGDVLFYEDWDPSSPVIVTHYTSFVKVDSWYHEPSEIVPSIWLKGLKVLFDPDDLISPIIRKSTELNYTPTSKEVLFWRTKVLAFAHETYRAVMREELYYALANLDRISLADCFWLVYGKKSASG
ncbi:aminoglycoside 6-adenylyltransferase [Bacillus sp. FJAT-18017]|uniref:aminoglycoside 6-adenylyltransferase n=1 Tax=Bacillus sp. FJAT-18017 TaxID=1705566 RepID=UPI000AAAF546|nr:aminoglycoside 6-adenylyltransferase [Bacillus sp. FJAT-18017]